MAGSNILSALVVARNEAGQLADCLGCLSFCDEIVVVLDRSTDASAIIAKAHQATLVEGAWEREGPRRQAGQDVCRSDWILEVDADERVTPELAKEIQAIMQNPQGDFYRIPFDNYVGRRLVRYGWGAQFGVSAKVVMHKRGSKAWDHKRVHPGVTMQGRLGGVLKNRMVHYVDTTIADMFQRLDRYTSLHAIDMAEANEIGTFRRNFLRFFGRFYKCFVRRQGWREGELGFLIALFAGLYPLLSYLKARHDHK